MSGHEVGKGSHPFGIHVTDRGLDRIEPIGGPSQGTPRHRNQQVPPFPPRPRLDPETLAARLPISSLPPHDEELKHSSRRSSTGRPPEPQGPKPAVSSPRTKATGAKTVRMRVPGREGEGPDPEKRAPGDPNAVVPPPSILKRTASGRQAIDDPAIKRITEVARVLDIPVGGGVVAPAEHDPATRRHGDTATPGIDTRLQQLPRGPAAIAMSAAGAAAQPLIPGASTTTTTGSKGITTTSNINRDTQHHLSGRRQQRHNNNNNNSSNSNSNKDDKKVGSQGGLYNGGGLFHSNKGGGGHDNGIDIDEDDPYVFSAPSLASAPLWHAREFGTLLPAGEGEAEAVGARLEEEVAKLAAVRDANPADVVTAVQRAYSVCFREVIRQVSITCSERGLLLARVWSKYVQLFRRVLEHSERDKARLLSELAQRHERKVSAIRRGHAERVKEAHEDALAKLSALTEHKKRLGLKRQDLQREMIRRQNELEVFNKRHIFLSRDLQYLRDRVERSEERVREYEAIRQFLTAGSAREVIAREMRGEAPPPTETVTNGDQGQDPASRDADKGDEQVGELTPENAEERRETARTRMQAITDMIQKIQAKIDALPLSVRPGILRTLMQDIRHSFEQRVPKALRAETRTMRLDTLPSLALALVAIERHLSSEEQWLLARMVETGVLPTDEGLAAKGAEGGVPKIDKDTVNVIMAATGSESGAVQELLNAIGRADDESAPSAALAAAGEDQANGNKPNNNKKKKKKKRRKSKNREAGVNETDPAGESHNNGTERDDTMRIENEGIASAALERAEARRADQQLRARTTSGSDTSASATANNTTGGTDGVTGDVTNFDTVTSGGVQLPEVDRLVETQALVEEKVSRLKAVEETEREAEKELERERERIEREERRQAEEEAAKEEEERKRAEAVEDIGEDVSGKDDAKVDADVGDAIADAAPADPGDDQGKAPAVPGPAQGTDGDEADPQAATGTAADGAVPDADETEAGTQRTKPDSDPSVSRADPDLPDGAADGDNTRDGGESAHGHTVVVKSEDEPVDATRLESSISSHPPGTPAERASRGAGSGGGGGGGGGSGSGLGAPTLSPSRTTPRRRRRARTGASDASGSGSARPSRVKSSTTGTGTDNGTASVPRRVSSVYGNVTVNDGDDDNDDDDDDDDNNNNNNNDTDGEQGDGATPNGAGIDDRTVKGNADGNVKAEGGEQVEVEEEEDYYYTTDDDDDDDEDGGIAAAPMRGALLTDDTLGDAAGADFVIMQDAATQTDFPDDPWESSLPVNTADAHRHLRQPHKPSPLGAGASGGKISSSGTGSATSITGGGDGGGASSVNASDAAQNGGSAVTGKHKKKKKKGTGAKAPGVARRRKRRRKAMYQNSVYNKQFSRLLNKVGDMAPGIVSVAMGTMNDGQQDDPTGGGGSEAEADGANAETTVKGILMVTRPARLLAPGTEPPVPPGSPGFLKPLRSVLRIVSTSLLEKISADTVDDTQRNRRQTLPEFLYTFHLFKYGLRQLAEKFLCHFLANVLYHAPYNRRVATYAAFLGLRGTASPDSLDLYLYALTCLKSSLGSTFLDNDPPPATVAVPLQQALDLAAHVFHYYGDSGKQRVAQIVMGLATGGAGANSNSAGHGNANANANANAGTAVAGNPTGSPNIASNISNTATAINSLTGGGSPIVASNNPSNTTNSSNPNPSPNPVPTTLHGSTVDCDELLAVLVDEWETRGEQGPGGLTSLFDAGDADGDGLLKYEEFRSIVEHIDPTRSPVEVARMFHAAQDMSASALGVDLESFMAVVKEAGLASWKATAVMPAAPSSNPQQMVDILESTWETTANWVIQQLDAVTAPGSRVPPDVAERISARYTAFVSTLKDISPSDVGVAWLKYRMLMDDIHGVVQDFYAVSAAGTTPARRR